MTSRHDELVEEIAAYFRGYVRAHEDVHYGKIEREEQIYWSVARIIERTLKAVVDGELDEVLGVVGRIWARLATRDWIMDRVNEGADVIIALSGEGEEGEG